LQIPQPSTNAAPTTCLTYQAGEDTFAAVTRNKLGRLAGLLRSRRVAAGLTLREVTRRTGISNPYLSQLENGHTTNPSPRLLEKLANAFGCSYLELMEAAGYKPPVDIGKVTLEVAMLASDLDVQEQGEVAAFIRRLVAGRPVSQS
jgi:transcriptional regulator with XRE-family HTH domain